jgi:hypothetical protein
MKACTFGRGLANHLMKGKTGYTSFLMAAHAYSTASVVTIVTTYTTGIHDNPGKYDPPANGPRFPLHATGKDVGSWVW